MYFKKFNDFSINEANEDRLKRRAKRKELKAKHLDAIGKEDKAEKLQNKADELKAKAGEEPTEDTSKDKGIVKTDKVEEQPTKEEPTEEKGKEVSEDTLQKQLIKWNIDFADAFKFSNNEPKEADIKDNDVSGQFNVLISKLSTDERKTKVKNALAKLMGFFANGEYDEKQIDVIGFTSTTASDQYNKELSLRRSGLVINAIKDLMQQKKIDSNIVFNREGFGEQEDRLVVKNDISTEKPIIGSNYKLSDATMKKIEGDKEARQELNRRVEITLKGKTPKYVIDNVPATEKKEKPVEKPTPPNPTEIQFNLNSYVLLEKSKQILSDFYTSVKTWNDDNDENKIENFIISAHTKSPRKQSATNEESHAMLSSNRAYVVKKYLENKKINVNILLLPCSFKVDNDGGEEKRVEINFEENDFVKKAKMEFAKLSQEYNSLEDDNGFYGTDDIVKNSPMRSLTLSNMKAKKFFRQIPPELWNIDNKGFREKDLERFQNRVKKASGLSDSEIIDQLVFKIK